MPDSYFFVKVWINKNLNVLGPYIRIKDAADILIDHIETLVVSKTNSRGITYKAEIHESILTDSGWETINIPIMENECYLKTKKL